MRPLSAAGAANMLYLVAGLNETLQHNKQWTNKCMQRNGGPCCYSIHTTYLNPTAHIRDNTMSTANDPYVARKGSGTQKYPMYKLMTISASYIILSHFQPVNTKGRMSVTMPQYHATNVNRTMFLHSHNHSIKCEWSATHIRFTSGTQSIRKWAPSTLWIWWQNEKSLPLLGMKPMYTSPHLAILLSYGGSFFISKDFNYVEISRQNFKITKSCHVCKYYNILKKFTSTW